MNWLDQFEDKFSAFANICYIILGNIIYAVSINVLITPMSLYNGGFLGMAQLLRLFFVKVLHFSGPPGMDLTGIIYFLMNVPLFYYAYRAMGIKFSIKSLISIGMSSLCLTLVPVPAKPLFNDYLSACVVAGVIGGVGSGMILRGGSSTGGSDIIGVCMSKTHRIPVWENQRAVQRGGIRNLSVGVQYSDCHLFLYLYHLFAPVSWIGCILRTSILRC